MKISLKRTSLSLAGLTIATLALGCASVPAPVPQPKRSSLVKIPLVVKPKIRNLVAPGSRIVITDLAGDCSDEVEDALMQRLIDNADYDILTRKYLWQILLENRQVIGAPSMTATSLKNKFLGFGESEAFTTDIPAQPTWEGEFNSATGAKLGELLGASQFIVGRVIHCGNITQESITGPLRGPMTIIALLQILDLQTGKIVLSTSASGEYSPRFAPYLSGERLDQARFGLSSSALLSGSTESTENRKKVTTWFSKRLNNFRLRWHQKLTNLPKLRAAENLAHRFADKFFARPSWESVEMYDNPYWHYGDSIHYVKLGRCSVAVKLLESVTTQELSRMPSPEVGELLHNYGVALLCANQPEQALQKLRAAYRINYHPSTQEMISLTSKVLEWKLDIEVDHEPETEIILEMVTLKEAQTELTP